MKICKMDIGDSLFMACGNENEVEKIYQFLEIKLEKN